MRLLPALFFCPYALSVDHHGDSRVGKKILIDKIAASMPRVARPGKKANTMIAITLPDGSKREFDSPISVHGVAASIGAGLARAALAGKVDGKLVDTSFVIDHDASLAIVTDKDADGLDVIRHSTAHLLAYAVKSLFPDAQVTIGPVIDDGFYYDFSYSRPFTPEDLAAIEKKMAELAKQDIPVERYELSRDEAVAYFKGIGEKNTKPRSSNRSRLTRR